MNCNPASELKDKEFKKIMEIYESLSSDSNTYIKKETNMFYKGCVAVTQCLNRINIIKYKLTIRGN